MTKLQTSSIVKAETSTLLEPKKKKKKKKGKGESQHSFIGKGYMGAEKENREKE